jgi:hypothetical protein
MAAPHIKTMAACSGGSDNAAAPTPRLICSMQARPMRSDTANAMDVLQTRGVFASAEVRQWRRGHGQAEATPPTHPLPAHTLDHNHQPGAHQPGAFVRESI